MSQLSSTLREAADKNHELLTELAATDYAPSSLKQNGSFIEDLKKQIKELDAELKKLHEITEDERKDHVSYRDSNVKRWMHKMGGSKGQAKFQSKQEKEEREFMEAWQKERSANESRDELGRTLARAEEDRKNIEADVQRQEKAQTELDALYNSIFSGPTPDVPGEDQAEEAVNLAKANLSFAQDQLKNDKTANEFMQKAALSMKSCMLQINDALKHSRRDIYGGIGFDSLMEQDALASAQNNMSITRRHVTTARQYQSDIKEMPSIEIDQGDAMMNIMFDNVFSDIEQHETIMRTKMRIEEAAKELGREVKSQEERMVGSGGNVKRAGSDLEEARRELQRIRGEAFGRLMGGGGMGGEAPPAYGV